MQFANPFDARSVDPAQTFTPLPPGDYKVVITESEGVPTSKGDGGRLVFTLKVVDGQHQGRELKYGLNLFNPSQKAMEIAYRELSSLCHVVGVFQVQDSQQLHGIPFIVTVGIQSNNPQYNEITAVKDLAGNTPGKGHSTGVASAPAPQQPTQQMPPQQPQQWGPPQPAAQPAAPWGSPQAPQMPPQAQPQAPWGAQPQQPMQAPAAPPWGQQQPQAAPPWGTAPQAPQQPQQPAAPAQAPWAQGPPPAAPTWPGK